jgi:hypothetical protein
MFYNIGRSILRARDHHGRGLLHVAGTQSIIILKVKFINYFQMILKLPRADNMVQFHLIEKHRSKNYKTLTSKQTDR